MPYQDFDQAYIQRRNPAGKKQFSIFLRRMLDWQTMCYLVAEGFSAHSTKHELFEAFCRTMAFNCLPNRGATPGSEYIASFKALRRSYAEITKQEIKFGKNAAGFQRVQIAPIPPIGNTGPDEHVIYSSVFEKFSMGRKFCISRKGSTAWVPRDTKLSDVMCFLAGCSVPFVIRQEGNSFRLLGDCYLHSMMCDDSITFTCKTRLFVFK
jgi:hypothetical protein